jgi:hypothetical protein
MKTLPLKHPLTIGKKAVEALHFRDHATAGDMLAFDEAGATQQTISLIANLSGMDEALIKQLHVTDFRAADALCSDLIRPEATEKNAPES